MNNRKNDAQKKAETPLSLAWREFKKNKLAVLGLIIVILVALSAIFAPVITPYDPAQTNILKTEEPPSSEHWLGTDKVGRDIYTRLIYGGRVSIMVGLISMIISVSIGTVMGLLAGYFGGLVDTIIARLIDIFRSIPFLIIAITIASIWGPGLYRLMVIIGVLSWTGVARLVRGKVFSLREREFIEAARASGGNELWIMFKHLLPNSMAPIIVNATLRVAYSIISEAGLTFLGLGVQPPTASWGSMLKSAQSIHVLGTMPWYWIPPGVMVLITVMGINFVGDGLRDSLDPRQYE